MEKKEMLFAKELLQKRNLKVTVTRKEVLTAIYEYNTAIPYSDLQKQLPEADRITLYRTLNVLLENGIIHKAHTSNNESYYALCGAQCSTKAHTHNHIHFKCEVCKAVTCEDLLQELEIKLPKFQINTININASGICNNCNITT